MVNENIRIFLNSWLLVRIPNPCIERLLHQRGLYRVKTSRLWWCSLILHMDLLPLLVWATASRVISVDSLKRLLFGCESAIGQWSWSCHLLKCGLLLEHVIIFNECCCIVALDWSCNWRDTVEISLREWHLGYLWRGYRSGKNRSLISGPLKSGIIHKGGVAFLEISTGVVNL